jgi:peptide/nickel transport system permease protein
MSEQQGRISLSKRVHTLEIGVTMISVLVLVAVVFPLVSGADPNAQVLTEILQPPSWEHPFGTDNLGRDLVVRLIFAAQTDLRIMVLAEIFPFCFGVSLGILAGYKPGPIDAFVVWITNTIIAFPFYVLVIAVAFAAGAGEQGIYITFILVGWVVYARVIRGATRPLASSDWVLAAKSLGYSNPRIVFRHLLPNVAPQAVVLLMTYMVVLLVMIVTLGYLGIGVQLPTPDWGTMIADGEPYITTKWWLCAIPGLAVVYTGIGLSLIGDGLADRWRVR